MFGGDNLHSMYQTNFNLMQNHKYSLSDLEDMIPYERAIYITLLNAHIEKENARISEDRKRQEMEMQNTMKKMRKRNGR